MACRRLKELINELLISIPEIARKANKSEKTVRNLIGGTHQSRPGTKRAVLKAINQDLKERNRDPVGPEIFE